jgi:hypothetical protein
MKLKRCITLLSFKCLQIVSTSFVDRYKRKCALVDQPSRSKRQRMCNQRYSPSYFSILFHQSFIFHSLLSVT